MCLWPVSYTHLDVYKRQGQRRSAERLQKLPEKQLRRERRQPKSHPGAAHRLPPPNPVQRQFRLRPVRAEVILPHMPVSLWGILMFRAERALQTEPIAPALSRRYIDHTVTVSHAIPRRRGAPAGRFLMKMHSPETSSATQGMWLCIWAAEGLCMRVRSEQMCIRDRLRRHGMK